MKDLKNTLDQVIKAGAQDIAASRGNVTRHTLVDLQRWADALPVYAADVAGEEATANEINAELLEACQQLINMITHQSTTRADCAIIAIEARAVIARATK